MDDEILTAHLHRGLRVARTAIAAVIFIGLVLPNVLANFSSFRPSWLAITVYLALAVVVAADGFLVARHRTWGWARVPVAVAVLALSVAGTAALPAEALVGPAHQTLGYVGWLGVLLFADTSLRSLVVFLTVHFGLSYVQLALAGRGGLDDAAVLATVAVGTMGFQLAVGVAGLALRSVAHAATAAAVRQAELRTAEAVAEQIHADREARYARLRDTAAPLLRAIGEHRLDPSDPEVQRRAAIEAARMRRLFTEDGDSGDPLTGELAALIDVAERKGTLVHQSARGRWPAPPAVVRQVLLDEVAAVLLAAERTARVTLGGAGEGVTVSVIADGPAPPSGTRRRSGVVIMTLSELNQVWVEARWHKNPQRAS
ncbi:MAG: hypothetical protein L0K86_01080 [Actinomycetia bacterium]|nr:hypothetical protein [Actinomycetes bacterium]